MSIETVSNTLALWDAEVPKLEAQLAPLKKEAERARAELDGRSKALADAQSEAQQAARRYQGECRKLASGEPSEALELKGALQESEAKIEGLKQLLADAQQKATAARSPVADVERQLAEARHEREAAFRRLKAEEILQRVGEKFLSLLEDVRAASNAVADLGEMGDSGTFVQSQGARLWKLQEELRGIKYRAF